MPKSERGAEKSAGKGQKGSPPSHGLDQQHTYVNPADGERRKMSQREYKATIQADGWIEESEYLAQQSGETAADSGA